MRIGEAARDRLTALGTTALGMTALGMTALRRSGREREVVVQAVKAALAAVVAMAVTAWWGGEQAFLAPYAAVLSVTTTVRGSWAGAARQAAIVAAGVLLAFALNQSALAPLISVPLAVVVGLLVGRWRVFGADGYWVAITALILLMSGTSGHPADLLSRIALSIIGSLAGALVNTLLLPPVHLQDAHDAVRGLCGEVAEQLRAMAGQVREGWSTRDTDSWIYSSRGLRSAVRRADDAVWHGRESVRWNPRRRQIRRADSPLAGATVVDRLSRVSERVLQVAVLLGDLAGVGDQPPDPALADQLCRLADGVDALAANPHLDVELPDSLSGPAQQVRELRAETETGPEVVRGACMITVSDALTELTRPRPDG